MLIGYLFGFVIQYRSMKRLIQFLTKNRYVRWSIFVLSLFLMVVYLCALVQALFYFWGEAAMLQTQNNSKNFDFGCFNAFVKTFMDDKYDLTTYNGELRFYYY